MDIEKLDGLSMDMEDEARKRLQQVFPECFAEGKLDIDKLLSMCGEYITNDYEKYKFEWKGKGESLILAQKRSTGTLRPCPKESDDFDNTKNVYIEGDNLEVLKLLQTAYYRKVKMIYIDPPYNTGNDFIYEDDFAEPLLSYKEVINQATKSNPETMGRFHTNWLNMMYPRLKLAATLLRDDGVCFISIDDNEVHNLRKMCDEVFGEENFVAEFIRVGNSAKNNVKLVSVTHEYCLVYAKNIGQLEEWTVPRTNSEEFQKRAKQLLKKGLQDSEIREELRSLVKYPRFYDFDHYTYCDNKGVFRANDLTAPNSKSYFDIIHPVTGKACKKSTRGWAYSQEGMQELIENDLIYFGHDENSVPQLKCYLFDTLDQVPRGIMFYDTQNDTKWIKSNGLGFDFPKPVEFIKQLVTMCSKPDDIILDFFSGSATTAHAVMQLNKEDGGNRRFIMVQLPEICDEKSEASKAGYQNICDIGKERIRRAGGKLLAEKEEEEKQLTLEAGESKPLDTGFRVFKLDTSNLKKWDSTPLGDNQPQSLFERIENMMVSIKADRTAMDVVWEVALKMGVLLDAPVIPLEIGGKTAYAIGEECLLLVCLEGGLTVEDIEAMAEYAPGNIVLAENGIEDDTVMSNAFYILKDRNIKLKLV